MPNGCSRGEILALVGAGLLVAKALTRAWPGPQVGRRAARVGGQGSAAAAPYTGTLSEVAREAYFQTGTVREPHPVIPDQKERKRRWMQRLEGWHKWYCPVCQEHVDVKGYNKGQYYRRKHLAMVHNLQLYQCPRPGKK